MGGRRQRPGGAPRAGHAGPRPLAWGGHGAGDHQPARTRRAGERPRSTRRAGWRDRALRCRWAHAGGGVRDRILSARCRAWRRRGARSGADRRRAADHPRHLWIERTRRRGRLPARSVGGRRCAARARGGRDQRICARPDGADAAPRPGRAARGGRGGDVQATGQRRRAAARDGCLLHGQTIRRARGFWDAPACERAGRRGPQHLRVGAGGGRARTGAGGCGHAGDAGRRDGDLRAERE